LKNEFKTNASKDDKAYQIHKKYSNISIADVYKWNLADLIEIDDGLNAIMGKNGFKGDEDAFVTAFGKATFVPAANRSLGTTDGKNNVATTLNGIVKVTPSASMWTILHEMGHVLSAAPTLDGRTTSSYGQMYSNVFDHTRPGTTKYGTTNTGEDFADSFYAVIRYGPNNMPPNSISLDRIQVIVSLIQSYVDLDQTTGQ